MYDYVLYEYSLPVKVQYLDYNTLCIKIDFVLGF